MRTWRGSVRFALSVVAASAIAAPASAQLLIATPLGESAAVASAEMAFASGGGAPVTWIAFRLHGAPVALVTALPDGAKSGPALDAWLSALELTASPNVLLPNNADDCGKTSSYVHVAWPRSAGQSPDELSVQQPEDVAAALESAGLSLWGTLPKASRYVVWTWPKSEGERTTKTLRVVGGEAPLSLLPGPQFPLVVSAITRDPVSYPGELPNTGLDVTFVAGEPRTDYLDRLQRFLRPDSPPVLEMRGRTPLFDWSVFDGNVSLAPLVRSYATRAKGELPKLDDQACSDQLRALRDPEAPSAAACGAADDASLALAAVASDRVTLQRFIAPAHSGLAPAEAASGGAWQSPIVQAERLDATACPHVEGPPVVIEPARPTETGPTESGPSGTATVGVEQTVVVDDGNGYQDGGCGCGTTTPDPTYEQSSDRSSCSSDTSSTSDSSSGCSGDSSSSSSDSSSDSCSGDSSSSSSSDSSSGCSGDSSSSSSDSSSDSCSGDSSSSSSSASGDSGCSGGSKEGSSYDGDTCTASARPGAERAGQSQASLRTPSGARGARRVKTSLWGVAMLALVLPIRRRKRGGRRPVETRHRA